MTRVGSQRHSKKKIILLGLSATEQKSGSPNVAFCRWQCYFVFLRCRVLIPTRGQNIPRDFVVFLSPSKQVLRQYLIAG